MNELGRTVEPRSVRVRRELDELWWLLGELKHSSLGPDDRDDEQRPRQRYLTLIEGGLNDNGGKR